jgi:hypothetical protein
MTTTPNKSKLFCTRHSREEKHMYPFLKSLIAAISKFGRRRCAPRQEQRVQLNVETMETRLVPSTMVPKPAMTLTAPALTASISAHAEGTGGHSVADPEAVHGYKWRRYRPWPYATASEGQAVQMAPIDYYLRLDGVPGEDSVKAVRPKMARPSHPLVVPQDVLTTPAQGNQSTMAQASHLLVGGSDGPTVAVASDGHLVINIPRGPAPTDAAVSER